MKNNGQEFEKFLRKREIKHRLILHNDDLNPVLDVVTHLVYYAKHDPLQAEQCAILAEAKGSCPIFTGIMDNILLIKDNLTKNGLKVTIDSY